MIIRSMSRKDASFAQLITYVTRDAADVRYQIAHNMKVKDHAATIAEFEQNASLLRKRADGVVVFHEILSIQRSSRVPLGEQKDILRSFALDYLKSRAPGNLAFGALHDDHAKHLHYHLVISANDAGERRRQRLSPSQFNAIKARLETKMLALHPELEQGVAMNKAARRQLSQRGEAMKQRIGRTPDRDRVVAALRSAFAAAGSQQDLFDRLSRVHLELIRRGKTITVVDQTNERRHRLTTLGLDAEFSAMTDRLAQTTAVQHVQATVKQKAASLQPKPQNSSAQIQAGQPTAQNTPSNQSTTEADVNVFDALTQGLAAIVDAASLSSPSAESATVQKADDRLSERDRIAAERLAEMHERREDQDREQHRENDQARTRTR